VTRCDASVTGTRTQARSQISFPPGSRVPFASALGPIVLAVKGWPILSRAMLSEDVRLLGCVAVR
jgi:hypothetical protein